VGAGVCAGAGECPQGPPPLLVVPASPSRVPFLAFFVVGGCGGLFLWWGLRVCVG